MREEKLNRVSVPPRGKSSFSALFSSQLARSWAIGGLELTVIPVSYYCFLKPLENKQINRELINLQLGLYLLLSFIYNLCTYYILNLHILH